MCNVCIAKFFQCELPFRLEDEKYIRFSICYFEGGIRSWHMQIVQK